VRTEQFDYSLPRELIATLPAEKREQSRLLVLDRKAQTIEHRHFFEIINYLHPGDVLVVNDSRVIRARMHGKRLTSGGKVEFLLLERCAHDSGENDRWIVMCRPAKKLKPGEEVYFANKQLMARVLHYRGEGEREVEFNTPDVLAWLDVIGEIPLPPYILQRRQETHFPVESPSTTQIDAERYQTIYAREPGSVAAPTAGLHFSEELLDRVRQLGVEVVPVTLHVGPGTFKPVESENIENHPMHSERFVISQQAADSLNLAHEQKRRIMCVGTTSVRSIESATDSQLKVHAGEFSTSLMIYPGYGFKSVDALITNFHLPRSTLLMLVSAFAGREFVLRAYELAVRERYRFFSYGDAMLIV
jgi:S-adenosylmethionine:tRNA ribosyltransferase-isomerase